jgi:hypothetical protein
MMGKGASTAMSAVGGGKGKSGGGQQAQSGGQGGQGLQGLAQLAQAFTGASGGGSGGGGAGGGSTPQQSALSDFMAGQQILGARATFAHTGTGHSTMARYAARSAGQPDPAQQKQQDKSLANLASGAGFEAGYSGDSGLGSQSSPGLSTG